MIPVRPTNNVVALRVIGAAVIGIAATGSCGLALNNYVMNANNEYERALAVKVGWNLQEAKLYAFDESHPNNQSTSALADIAKQKNNLEATNRRMALDEKEGRLRRFNLRSKGAG